MTTVQDILKKKGESVETVSPDTTVLDAAKKMNAGRIGALIVENNKKVVGIFSERDILTRVIAPQLDPSSTPVSQVMTTQVAYCTRDTTIEHCRSLMSDQRVRHLPIIEDEELVGIVTIGDLNAWQVDAQGETIRHLNQYIYGTR